MGGGHRGSGCLCSLGVCVSGLRSILRCTWDVEGLGEPWSWQGLGVGGRVDGEHQGFLGDLGFLGGSGKSWLPGITRGSLVGESQGQIARRGGGNVDSGQHWSTGDTFGEGSEGPVMCRGGFHSLRATQNVILDEV